MRLRVIFPSARSVYPDSEVELRTEDIRAGAGIPVLNRAEIGIRAAEVVMAALQ